ncbi:hypothetical protein FIT70_04285 [Candidatus Methylopumilus universalis]|uniref:hypothetical protein n=1 Tax=Candidatus Methylopumilus universalis TaxID=2588536 RepID=UPI0011222DC2|nr:hypothetical protein [Candidatus Methylopumilus universalis]QDC99130.1 hypothetical protein FIT70_04285 [Candidatus Methylopumilus universalis]
MALKKPLLGSKYETLFITNNINKILDYDSHTAVFLTNNLLFSKQVNKGKCLIYGEHADSLNKSQKQTNVVYKLINEKIRSFCKLNSIYYFFLKIEGHAEGDNFLSKIQNYFFDFNYLKKLHTKYNFDTVVLDSLDIVEVESVINYCTDAKIAIRFKKFHFLNLLNKIKKKMKLYFYDFRLILFFIYRKILYVGSHAYSLAKYDVAIHQNSVLEKHFRPSIALSKALKFGKRNALIIIWNPREKFNIYSNYDHQYYLINDVSLTNLIGAFKQKIKLFHFVYTNLNFFVSDIALPENIKDIVKKEIIFSVHMNLFSHMLFRMALAKLYTKNVFNFVRPSTQSLNYGQITFDLSSKIYKDTIFFMNYDFNVNFDFIYPLSEIRRINEKFNVLNLANNRYHHKYLINVRGSKKTIILGSIMRSLIEKKMLGNSALSKSLELDKNLVFSRIKNFKMKIFFVTNEILKGFYSYNDFNRTFITLVRFLSQHQDVCVILKKRPSRTDFLFNYLNKQKLNNFFFFEDHIDPYDILNFSDCIISKFTSLLEEGSIFGKVSIQVDYENEFDFYSKNVTKVTDSEVLYEYLSSIYRNLDKSNIKRKNHILNVLHPPLISNLDLI